MAIISKEFCNFASNLMAMENLLLCTKVGKLRNKLHRLMKQRIAAEADIKLTVEEFMILKMLDAKPDQILQDIALITGKNKSVVLRMVDSIESKGLCKRSVNPTDRRENFLNITEEGKKVVAQYQQIENRLSADLIARIPYDKVDTFLEVIDLISKNCKES